MHHPTVHHTHSYHKNAKKEIIQVSNMKFSSLLFTVLRLLPSSTSHAQNDTVSTSSIDGMVQQHRGLQEEAALQFQEEALVLESFGYNDSFTDASGGWLVNRHPRFVVDVNGDDKADIVGFGIEGVYVALGKGDGTFESVALVLEHFGYADASGGWRVNRHPRFVVDINGDDKADIVGFANEGSYVSLGKGDGTFEAVTLAQDKFGYTDGWRVDRHPRFVVDINGDDKADIVGFANNGVYVSLGKGDGTFEDQALALSQQFSYIAGAWRVDRHPRFLVDINGDKTPDIVGFGNGGVSVALGRGDGTFARGTLVLAQFGYIVDGWRVNLHPRFVVDVDGDTNPDIVGFFNDGVYVALGKGDGTFETGTLVLEEFGNSTGSSWIVDRHPRFVIDVNGDDKADIVGFGDLGVSVALSKGNGTFEDQALALEAFGYNAVGGDWRVDRHPRFVVDIDGDDVADIVGFDDLGVVVALNIASLPEQPPLICFPSVATCHVKDVGKVPMEQLKLGDAVLVDDDRYERIYSFGHHSSQHSGHYLELIMAQQNTMLISKDHMVFVEDGRSIPAGMLMVGDVLQLPSLHDEGQVKRDTGRITHIRSVNEKGAFAPFTPSGTIVVNGVKASSYVSYQQSENLVIGGIINTGISHQILAHTFKAPHRIYCTYLSNCNVEQYTVAGVSTWVDFSHTVAQWYFAQSNWTAVFLAPLFLVLFIVAAILPPLWSMHVAVAIAAVVWTSRKLGSKCA